MTSQLPPQPNIRTTRPIPCTNIQCHTTCRIWRCCQCPAECPYNALWCVCDHLICQRCKLVYEGCRITRESPEKMEPIAEPPVEGKEVWSSEDWEMPDDGQGGKEEEEREEEEEEEKPTTTCWMLWECCACGANNAPSRGKCRRCAQVKCDLCDRILPQRAAFSGDFL